MSSSSVSASTEVRASPSTVFAILADPRQHQRIDGSGSVRGSVSGPERLELGSTFAMDMKLGAAYQTKNTVVEFEEDRLIAWKHFAPHRWRYELEPTAEGTRVTETWDLSRVPFPIRLGLRLLRFPERTRSGIEGTLRNLGREAEADERAGD